MDSVIFGIFTTFW